LKIENSIFNFKVLASVPERLAFGTTLNN